MDGWRGKFRNDHRAVSRKCVFHEHLLLANFTRGVNRQHRTNSRKHYKKLPVMEQDLMTQAAVMSQRQ
ncbi:hypothetical protein NDU88_005749 [Pleurodeles waltl]|uniref:Uncharacterized protein n=1 Tax=Pleurodeles waltl TaxID=8319 RepID=A0AAV7NPY0_PLEWA|nr:hypothetical protein NDU88_005749 [Pleurodeles waltl]